MPLPNSGYITINSFLIKSQEPVLVDTGMRVEASEWMEALKSVIDPEDIRWIWITHDDADHTGSVEEVLRQATNARIVTNLIGLARSETAWHIKLEDCHLLKQGESLHVGDRNLTAFRPPLFDSPATMGLYDDKNEAFFSSDCFGAFIPEPVQDAADVPPEALSEGFSVFNRANHPWVHLTDATKFGRVLRTVEEMNPQIILSAHLPPARGRTDEFLRTLATLPDLEPFEGVNQAEVEAIMAQVNAGIAPSPS